MFQNNLTPKIFHYQYFNNPNKIYVYLLYYHSHRLCPFSSRDTFDSRINFRITNSSLQSTHDFFFSPLSNVSWFQIFACNSNANIFRGTLLQRSLIAVIVSRFFCVSQTQKFLESQTFSEVEDKHLSQTTLGNSP